VELFLKDEISETFIRLREIIRNGYKMLTANYPCNKRLLDIAAGAMLMARCILRKQNIERGD
jgi:hypothetical protein